MHILIVGDEQNWSECRDKFGDSHSYTCIDKHPSLEQYSACDVVFDFEEALFPERLLFYGRQPQKPVFLNSAKTSLGKINREGNLSSNLVLFGFAGLRTFLNRPILEVTIFRGEDVVMLEKVCNHLGTKFEIVADKVGMVTPRVICMIINEAYFAFEEGTASREDIDLAMKLGTSYPWGPFEWGQKIGIRNVYELLDAVYRDTRDDRYRISTMLRDAAAS